jgi:hypothetical protein
MNSWIHPVRSKAFVFLKPENHGLLPAHKAWVQA